MKNVIRKRNCRLFIGVIILSISIPYIVKYDMEHNYSILSEDQISGNTLENSIYFFIDECTMEQYFTIRGWAVCETETYWDNCTSIGLLDEQTEQVIIFPTIVQERGDVNAAFSASDRDYTNSGFYGKINAKNIDSSHSYKILLYFGTEQEVSYATQMKLVGGKLNEE